ncbi:MAG: hypothetical protein IK116_06055 [Firmicutes bacterium]|nr:hypothetical protein [Bacillota bacterium]
MKEGTQRSGGMWLLCFGVTAGAALCGRFDWLSALAGGVLGALACRCDSRTHTPLRVLQALWLAVPLCVGAQSARALFPDVAGSMYVPAVVLAMAWLLAQQSRGGLLACCAVVGFFVLGAVGIVSLCAVPKLTLRWLRPVPTLDGFLCALAIGAGGMLLAACGEEPGPGWRWSALLAPAILSALAGGCLSRPLAARQASAFYTLSRGVSLFGVAERFEALIAACLTLGLCSACALILRAGRALLGSDWAILLIPAALALCLFPIPGLCMAAGTVVFWVILPALWPLGKKLKIRKKSS